MVKYDELRLRLGSLASVISSQKPRKEGKTRRLSLRVNFAWSLLGNVVYAASQWGILVVLAKVSTPESVGQFTLGLAISAPVIMFAGLQLRAVQATDAHEEYQFGHYLGLRLIMAALAFAIIVGIAFVSSYETAIVLTISAVALAKVFESISDVSYGLFQRQERMDRIAISMVIKGPLSLATLGLIVWRTDSVVLGAVGLAFSWLALLLLYDLRNARRLAPIVPLIHTKRLWRLTKQSLPLGIVMLLLSLNTNVPRYAVERYIDVGSLGIFAAMAYLIQAGTIVVTALGNAASPRLSNLYAHDDVSGFNRLLMKLVGIALLLGISGIILSLAAGKELLTLLYTPEYAEYGLVLTWLMLVGALQYLGAFFGTAVTAKRRFKVQVPIQAAQIILTLLLSIYLIPDFGLIGAAWAMALSAALATSAYGVIAFRPW